MDSCANNINSSIRFKQRAHNVQHASVTKQTANEKKNPKNIVYGRAHFSYMSIRIYGFGFFSFALRVSVCCAHIYVRIPFVNCASVLSLSLSLHFCRHAIRLISLVRIGKLGTEGAEKNLEREPGRTKNVSQTKDFCYGFFRLFLPERRFVSAELPHFIQKARKSFDKIGFWLEINFETSITFARSATFGLARRCILRHQYCCARCMRNERASRAKKKQQ